MDTRFEALKEWTARVLGAGAWDIRSASADASFRRYFRVRQGARSLIAVDAPPDQVDMRSYLAVAERFHALGLNVPQVHAADPRQGFYLVTDLGERLYLRQLSDETVEHLYGDALGALIVLQAATGAPGAANFLPDYDRSLLAREVGIFSEWYLGRHLGLALTAAQQQVFDEVTARLVESALSQPQVWVHRDYHSRNLMVTATNNPGILDFQDAVRGPVTYDLVSLLRDCYIAWPRARVEQWAKGYYELARQSGIAAGEDKDQFLHWFDLMGVQRHLKAVGIFARLNHRDGKPGYLDDIPRTLGYIYEVSTRRPVLHPLLALLRELKLPGAA